jgi:hypothetical protein
MSVKILLIIWVANRFILWSRKLLAGGDREAMDRISRTEVLDVNVVVADAGDQWNAHHPHEGCLPYPCEVKDERRH